MSVVYESTLIEPAARLHHVPLHQSGSLKEAGEVRKFLKAHFTQLRNPEVDLLNKADKRSPVARHYLFQQTWSGVPVYGASIKINVDTTGRILSIFETLINCADWQPGPLKSYLAQIDSAGAVSSVNAFHSDQASWRFEKVILPLNPPVACGLVTVYDELDDRYLEYIITVDGDILSIRDLNRYYQPNDTIVQGLVFNPDPLTTAHVTYGFPFVDDGDNDIAELNSQRWSVFTTGKLDNGQFSLENAYIRLQNFSPPNLQPSVEPLPYFTYTRAQQGFEEFNVLYHITNFQEYLQSLGFELVNYQIAVDAHALNGDDNSMFSSGSNPPRLFFGEGGVDDAEDADVIIHEYGHAISHSAAPFTNNGFERQALDEALGDYLCVSYSRSIDDYKWENVFSWDGHNEYWNGRNAASNKTYPGGLDNSIHSSGEIFSSVMMEIWGELGRTVTDQLVLQSLYSWASFMTMKHAALLVLQADTLLYGGAHFCTLYRYFLKRGLVDSLSANPCRIYDSTLLIDTGDDTVLCLGDSVMLGGMPTGPGDAQYLWEPAYGLNDPASPNPVASPDSSVTYLLTVTTSSGRYNQAYVKIEIQECPNQIEIRNSYAFAYNMGKLQIRFPYQSTENKVEIYNLLGQRIGQIETPENTYHLAPEMLPAGVYVIRARTSSGKKVWKILKLR